MLKQENLKAYTILEKHSLEELNAEGYILEHNKTKARVVAISNDDNNKVFTIGFRTPPTDDTGVPHIMEHSVLCGSKKFPAKDPFVELAKGSLNTFLNAMTYSDKTVYPIASCNSKDFRNLMHVYLDAVFYPNIYERKEILKQEGWHFDLDSLEGELSYNGVVYNEMKGVFSSPEQQLYRDIQKSLLPDTTYGCESGGDPDAIPDLTYEQFLDFHRKYYHPSNSYIYLYGDMDMEQELAFIDENYLDDFSYLEIDSQIQMQPAFSEPALVYDTYSLSDAENEKDNTYLSYNMVIGTSLDEKLYLAFQILDYVLLESPGAPVKKALIDAGIGKDILSSYDNGILQPIFSIVAKGANKEDKDTFISVLENTLKEIVKNGIEERSIRAAINYFEFKYKEANFGNYPKGLMYGLKAFDSWLYDDKKPFIHLKTNDVFHFLKAQIHTGYFEQLIDGYFLQNTHKSIVIVMPEKGYNQKLEAEQKKKLAAYKDTLSKEQLEKIIQEKKELEEYQSTPSGKEELEKIPLLNIEDIDKKAQTLLNETYKIAGIPVVQHKLFTNEISYVTLNFKMEHVDRALWPYASLLTAIYKYVDTANYSYNALSNEIDIKTGGIGFTLTGVVHAKTNVFTPLFLIKTKTLYGGVADAFQLIKEIIFTSKIDDEKRLKEIMAEIVEDLKLSITSSGHSFAANRAKSYFDESAYFKEVTDGIGFYEFLEPLYKNFDQKKDEIIQNLKAAFAQMVTKDNCIVSYTADNDPVENLKAPLEAFIKQLPADSGVSKKEPCKLVVLNEGFKTASKVQYVAAAGNYLKKGYAYSGALNVLQVIFSYDYLWINVRVKGGAYGAMCGFGRNGASYFTSYRDPNLMETYEIYKKAPEYVKSFQADDRDMTKYIIGAVAKLDAPMTPSARGAFCFGAYLMGITDEDLQKDRDELLATNQETIRGLAPLVEAIVDDNIICAIGDEVKLEEKKEYFTQVVSVF